MMIRTITVDSSVLIPLMLEDEEIHYAFSKKLFNFIFENKVIIVLPMLVLFEVFHTLKRLGFFEKEHGHEIFIDFLNYPYFHYIDLNMYFFNFFKQLDVFDNLKTSDATISSSAFLTKSILITWDKRLIENSYEAYTPEEFLKNFA